MVPRLSSHSLFSGMALYFQQWKNEYASDSILLYSTKDFQILMSILEECLVQVIQPCLSSWTSISYQLQCHLTDAFHWSILYSKAKIFLFRQIKTQIQQLLRSLQTCVDVLSYQTSLSTTETTPLVQSLSSLCSQWTSMANVDTCVWKGSTSFTSEWSVYLKYTLLPVLDTLLVTSMYADANPPTAYPEFNSWKYTNNGTNQKINWYFASSTPTRQWANISSIFFLMQFHSIVSLPFLTIYTKNTLGNYWYGKRKNFTLYSPTPTVSSSQWVLVYFGEDPTQDASLISPPLWPFPISSKISLQYDPDPIHFKTFIGGTDLASSDEILLIALSSDSSATLHNVSFALSMIGLKANQEWTLQRTCCKYSTLTQSSNSL